MKFCSKIFIYCFLLLQTPLLAMEYADGQKVEIQNEPEVFGIYHDVSTLIVNAAKELRTDSHPEDEFDQAVTAIAKGSSALFNLSTTSFDEEWYLGALRVAFFKDRNIAPAPYDPALREKPTSLWQDFNNPDINEYTILVLIRKDYSSAKIVSPIGESSNFFSYVDTRLSSSADNQKHFLYNSRQGWLLEFELQYRAGEYSFLIKELCHEYPSNPNLSIFKIKSTTQCSLLWWFLEKGVLLYDDIDLNIPKCTAEYVAYKKGDSLVQDPTRINSSYRTRFIERDRFAGEEFGKNRGVLPILSFGSPMILLQQDHQDFYVGVGHTKIENDPKVNYKPGSHVQVFKEGIHDFLEGYFDGNYTKHIAHSSNPELAAAESTRSYVYLMYFFMLAKNSDGNLTMKISDSFLPITKATDAEHNFSLVFPAGICAGKDAHKLAISMGVGDHYSAIIELEKDFVVQLCRHNVSDLDMNDYRYHVMRFNDNKSFIIFELD